MAKVITVKLGLDADEALGILGGVNKQLRAAFNVPTTQLNVVRGLFKNIQDSTTYTKKQFDSLVNKSSSILGQSVLSSPKQVNRSLLNTTLSNIKTDLFDVNSKIATEINNILKTPPASITKKQQALLTDWQTELNKKVDEYVPVPKGLNLNNVSWANNINPLVGQANKHRITETTLNSLLDIDNKLSKNGGKFELPYLDKKQTEHYYNSLTRKDSGVFKILDDEYDRLRNSQAYNKRNVDAYLASSNAELSYIQEYLTARGISGLDITRSTDEEFKAAKLAAGLTDTADIDELFKRATTTRERQNTLNNVLKNVRNAKNNELIKDLRQYGRYVNKTAITDKADNIEQYRNNLLNIHSTKSAILDELNNSYKLGLSNNYTDEQFKRAVEEYKQRADHIDNNATKRLNQLNRAYIQARTIEGQTESALDASEHLVEEQTIGKNIENINKRFENLDDTFTGLKRNKEFQRLTNPKGFVRNNKISANLKEDLTNFQNQQKAKLQELDSILNSRYKINLHGDYTKDNFIKAWTQAQDNLRADNRDFTKEEESNIAKIGRSIIATGKQQQAINNVLTSDQKQRQEEQEEEKSRQRFIANMNALSQASHRLGDMAWRTTLYGKGSVDEYVKYQSSVVGIAKLLPALRDKNTLIVNDKFKDFREGILKLTERLPSSGVELAHSAEVAARLGVTNPDRILDMVDLSAKLGATFGMAPDDVTQQVVKIANAMGYDFSDPDIKKKILDNVADPINYLDDHTAASGREILNFTKKSASIGRQVGMETKDVAAFGATLVSLGITSDSAATAFKNLITVMQTGARNQKKGKEYLEKAGFTQQELMEGMKKAPTATALKFLQQLNKLKTGKAGEDAASIARFGFGQMSLPGILALVNNPQRLQEYLEMARSGALNWTEIEYRAKEVNDPAIRFATMQNKYKELQITLGESLMPLADDLIVVLKKFSKDLIPAIKKNKELIKNLGIGAIGTAGLANATAFGADISILLANLEALGAGKWLKGLGTLVNRGALKGLLKIFGSNGARFILGSGGSFSSAFLPYLAGGVGLWSLYDGFFNGGYEKEAGKRASKENAKLNQAQAKVQGKKENIQARNKREHSSVFKQRKRDDLIYQFQNFGFVKDGITTELKLERDKDGKLVFNAFRSGEKYKDKEGNIYTPSIPIQEKDLSIEQQARLDEIRRLDSQVESTRAREGILNRFQGRRYDENKNITEEFQDFLKRNKISESNYKYYESFAIKQKELAERRANKEKDLVIAEKAVERYTQQNDKLKTWYYEKRIKDIKEELKHIKEYEDWTNLVGKSTEWDKRGAGQQAWIDINKVDKNKVDNLRKERKKAEEERKTPFKEAEEKQFNNWVNKFKKEGYSEQGAIDMARDVLLPKGTQIRWALDLERQAKVAKMVEDYKTDYQGLKSKEGTADFYNEGGYEKLNKLSELYLNYSGVLKKVNEDIAYYNQLMGFNVDKNKDNQNQTGTLKDKTTELGTAFKGMQSQSTESLREVKTDFDNTVSSIEKTLASKTFVFKFKAEGLENIPQGGGGKGDKPPEEYNQHK